MEALQGTARKLYDFAKLHGLRDDWHEPDEQGVRAMMAGEIDDFDNAFGDDTKSKELKLNLWILGSAGEDGKDIYLNMATLCALATIGAGVVLGETRKAPALSEYARFINAPVMPLSDAPRFSLNELNAILSTVLKSIGES